MQETDLTTGADYHPKGGDQGDRVDWEGDEFVIKVCETLRVWVGGWSV